MMVAFALCLARPAAAQTAVRPEALLPPDTLMYFGTDDLDAVHLAGAGSPLGQILAEEEMQEFLAKPLETLRKAIDEGLAMAKQEPSLAGVDLDLTKLKSAPFGRCFFAITHLDLPADMATDPSKFDLGLVVGLEPRSDYDVIGTVKQLAQTLAKEKGGDSVTVDSITVEGVTVDRLKAADAPIALCFANLGGVRVLSLSERSIREMAKSGGRGGHP